MDAPSFGLGFFLGALAALLTLGGLLFLKVRRTLRGLFSQPVSPRGPRDVPAQVETDADGFILTTSEER